MKNVERSQPDIRKVMAMARSANSKAAQERERAGARERMRRLRHEHASEADDRANVRALRDEGMYVKLPPEVRAHYGHIDFDPCPAFPEPGFDGLEVEWPDGTVLVHPPYVARHELKGRGTKAWVVKALAHHKKGNRVIVILSVHEGDGTHGKICWGV